MNNPEAEPRGILPQTCPPLRSYSLAGRLYQIQIYIDEICANQRNLPAGKAGLRQKKRNPKGKASRNSFDYTKCRWLNPNTYQGNIV
jgi:hypothetical protein